MSDLESSRKRSQLSKVQVDIITDKVILYVDLFSWNPLKLKNIEKKNGFRIRYAISIDMISKDWDIFLQISLRNQLLSKRWLSCK